MLKINYVSKNVISKHAIDFTCQYETSNDASLAIFGTTCPCRHASDAYGMLFFSSNAALILQEVYKRAMMNALQMGECKSTLGTE